MELRGGSPVSSAPCGGQGSMAIKPEEGRGYPPLTLKEGGPPLLLISCCIQCIVVRPQESVAERMEAGGQVPLPGPEGWGGGTSAAPGRGTTPLLLFFQSGFGL